MGQLLAFSRSFVCLSPDQGFDVMNTTKRATNDKQHLVKNSRYPYTHLLRSHFPTNRVLFAIHWYSVPLVVKNKRGRPAEGPSRTQSDNRHLPQSLLSENREIVVMPSTEKRRHNQSPTSQVDKKKSDGHGSTIKKEIKPQKIGKRGWEEIEGLFDDNKKKQKAAAAAYHPKSSSSQRKSTTSMRPAGSTVNHSRQDKASKKQGDDWVDDGLGGVYNKEGYTGRVEDGVRIFKAHIIQQQTDAGNTALCPFDCKCCYM